MSREEVIQYNQELMETAAFYINAALQQTQDMSLRTKWESLLSIHFFRLYPDVERFLQEFPESRESQEEVYDIWEYYRQLTPEQLALFAFETIQEIF